MKKFKYIASVYVRVKVDYKRIRDSYTVEEKEAHRVFMSEPSNSQLMYWLSELRNLENVEPITIPVCYKIPADSREIPSFLQKSKIIKNN